MKKARTWLDANRVAYRFHDYKVAGAERESLQRWCTALGWEVVLNRAGTTFRNLPDTDKGNLTESKAIDLMLARPSMIKRPVLETGNILLLGFKPEQYAALFLKADSPT